MLPKFRIWDKEEKHMKTFPSSVGHLVGEILTEQMRGESNSVVKPHHDKYVVMLGTGVKETKGKNNKEVFEDDIVKVTYEAVTNWLTHKIEKFEAVGQVVFLNKDPLSGRQMSKFVVKISADNWVSFFNCTSIEILGNIHENPVNQDEKKPFSPACDVFFSLRTPLEKIYGFIEYLRKKGFQSFLLPDGKTVRTEASIEIVKKVDKAFGVQSIATLKGDKECHGLRKSHSSS